MTEKFSPAAYWIVQPGSAVHDRVWFRQTVTLRAETLHKPVIVLFSAGEDAVLFVNGTPVRRGPRRSYAYDRGWMRMEVQSFLHPGVNVIAVRAAHLECDGLRLELTAAGRTLAATDSSWLCRREDARAADTAQLAVPLERVRQREEQFDARAWVNPHTPQVDPAQWQHAAVADGRPEVPRSLAAEPETFALTEERVFPQRVVFSAWSQEPEGLFFRLPGACTVRERAWLCTVTADAPCTARLAGSVRLLLNGTQTSGPHFELGENRLAVLCGFGEAQFALFPQGGALHCAAWSRVEAWDTSAEPGWTTPLTRKTGGESALLRAVCAWSAGQPLKTAAAPVTVENRAPAVSFLAPLRAYDGGAGCFAAFGLPALRPAHGNTPVPLGAPEQMLHEGPGAAVVRPSGDGRGNTFVLDFGQEVLGYVTFRVNASAGAALNFNAFETADRGGIVWMPMNGLRYLCRDGEQAFESDTPRGFRYLMVTVQSAEAVEFLDISVRQSVCPVAHTGTFRCGDETLNRIAEDARRTVLLCMKDTYIDCPGWEQVYWVGDALVTALGNLMSYGAYAFDQYSIRLTGQSLTEAFRQVYGGEYRDCPDGLRLTACAFSTFARGGIPVWSFLWAEQCRMHYLYGGDRADLAENAGYVCALADGLLQRVNARGLLELDGVWSLIEWSNNDLPACGEQTVNSAMLAQTCDTAAALLGALGQCEAAARYTKAAKNLREAVNRWCWSEAHGGYVDTVRDQTAYEAYTGSCRARGLVPEDFDVYRRALRVSQQTNTLVYLASCCTAQRRTRVEQLIRLALTAPHEVGSPQRVAFEERSSVVSVGSPFFRFFTLQALLKMGARQEARTLLLREWGAMLGGAGTCWETFCRTDEPHDTRSVCHAWSAAPAWVIPAAVLGVQPVEPGFAAFVAEPDPDMGDLEGSVPTPHGPIFVRVRGGVTEVRAPEGCRRVVPEQRKENAGCLN